MVKIRKLTASFCEQRANPLVTQTGQRHFISFWGYLPVCWDLSCLFICHYTDLEEEDADGCISHCISSRVPWRWALRPWLGWSSRVLFCCDISKEGISQCLYTFLLSFLSPFHFSAFFVNLENKQVLTVLWLHDILCVCVCLQHPSYCGFWKLKSYLNQN